MVISLDERRKAKKEKKDRILETAINRIKIVILCGQIDDGEVDPEILRDVLKSNEPLPHKIRRYLIDLLSESD